MGLDRRVRDLEDRVPQRECEECSGFFSVVINGEVERIDRYGRSASPQDRETYRRLMERLDDGECWNCGQRIYEVRMPSSLQRDR